MTISRQQRRARERIDEKRFGSAARAKTLAHRRAAAIEAWRNRNTVSASKLQKLVWGLEAFVYIFGGPLMWLYTPSFARRRQSIKKPPR